MAFVHLYLQITMCETAYIAEQKSHVFLLFNLQSTEKQAKELRERRGNALLDNLNSRYV